MSITSVRPPYVAYAPAQSARQSAPSERGSSMWMFMPVRMPGPTTIGVMPRNLTIAAVNECITFGTTDVMITSCTSRGAKPLSCRNCSIMMPNSSEVWFDLVVMR